MLTQVHIPNEPPLLPSKLPLRIRDLDPPLIHTSLGYRCPQPKWYLDRFRHFCRAQDCDSPTDRPHYSICNNRLHLCHAVMRPNKKDDASGISGCILVCRHFCVALCNQSEKYLEHRYIFSQYHNVTFCACVGNIKANINVKKLNSLNQ